MPLNITDRVLDKLGFSEYWDEHGTWGGRTLSFSDGTRFRIIEQEEMDDDSEGYSSDGQYVAQHFYFADWFAIPKIEGSHTHHDLFFLHEMHDCIKQYYPQCLEEFEAKCISLKMGKALTQSEAPEKTYLITNADEFLTFIKANYLTTYGCEEPEAAIGKWDGINLIEPNGEAIFDDYFQNHQKNLLNQ